MKESELLKLYAQTVAETGFQEDLKNPGWMPKLGPDNYRSVIRHGFYKGISAMIKVSSEENLDDIAKRFLRYQSATAQYPALRVPGIFASGSIPGAQWLIQESAKEGVRIVRNWPLATTAEKEEVARLYWNTVAKFPKYDFGEWSVADYFVMRMDKSLTAGRDYGVQTKGFISASEKDTAIKFIFTNVSQLGIDGFFDHFSNTDIVKADDQYYIWESNIEPRPETAGIALWLWAATLYAFNTPLSQWKNEIEAWIRVFSQYAPEKLSADIRQKINVNLAERFLSTLLVDLPLKRSPFENRSDADVIYACELFRALMHDIVSW